MWLAMDFEKSELAPSFVMRAKLWSLAIGGEGRCASRNCGSNRPGDTSDDLASNRQDLQKSTCTFMLAGGNAMQERSRIGRSYAPRF
jgi:hypothetical protein